MYRNSTIRPKQGICSICTDGKKKPLINGMCRLHYWENNRMRSANKHTPKDDISEDGLPELIADADAVFSHYMRLAAADELGIISCFICGFKLRHQEGQLMHFIPRGNLFLRWDKRNCRPGCSTCNEVKSGNYLQFAKKLNEDHPGITDILMEESRVVAKFTREDVRAIISEYSSKLKNLKKQRV